MASVNFINECKKGANSNRLGRITIDGINTQITQSNYLSSFSIDSGCYVDGNIIGSVYVKKLEGNFIAVPNDIELIDKTIQAQIGVKYGNNTTEYIDMGEYTVERPNDLKTANKCQITAYDDLMSKLNEKYICGIDYTQGNITTEDIYIDLCNQLNLTPSTTSFINDDIPVENNPFTNKETNRIVLQTIAKIACSFVTIDETTNEIDLSWLGESSFVNSKNIYNNNYMYMSDYYEEEEDKYFAMQTPLIDYYPEKTYSCEIPSDLLSSNYACLLGLYTANGRPAIGIDIFQYDLSTSLDALPAEAKEQIKKIGIILYKTDENSSYVELDLNEIENQFHDLKIYETGETDFYEFNLNDYSTLEGGTIQYGPINSVVIKNSQVDDENVSMQDSESIQENGEHSIIISEDYILYNETLRQQAITGIFNRLNGLEYIDSKLISYYGKPFLKIGDKIRIYTDNENYFDTYVLKHKFTYDGTFESIIESPALTEQEIKTKYDSNLQEVLANTQLEINKQNQTISATVQTISEQNTKISNVTQTVDNLNITITEQQNAFDNLNGSIATLEGSLQDMTFDFSTRGLAIGTSQDVNNSLLDNSGIKVYNYDKLNAIFNNIGSGIDKLIVTGTAQLGYLKFVKSTKNYEPVTKIFHLKELIEDLEDLE